MPHKGPHLCHRTRIGAQPGDAPHRLHPYQGAHVVLSRHPLPIGGTRLPAIGAPCPRPYSRRYPSATTLPSASDKAPLTAHPGTICSFANTVRFRNRPCGGHRSPTQDRAKYFYILSIVHQQQHATSRDQTPRRFNVETGPWKQQEKPSLPLDIPGRALSGKRCQPLLTACDPISLEHSLLHGIPGLECEVYLHRACNQHLARLNGRCRHIRVRPHLHSTAH